MDNNDMKKYVSSHIAHFIIRRNKTRSVKIKFVEAKNPIEI